VRGIVGRGKRRAGVNDPAEGAGRIDPACVESVALLGFAVAPLFRIVPLLPLEALREA